MRVDAGLKGFSSLQLGFAALNFSEFTTRLFNSCFLAICFISLSLEVVAWILSSLFTSPTLRSNGVMRMQEVKAGNSNNKSDRPLTVPEHQMQTLFAEVLGLQLSKIHVESDFFPKRR